VGDAGLYNQTQHDAKAPGELELEIFFISAEENQLVT
jgi:hypothetical protein